MRALVDTGALLALSRRKDQHHARAIAIAERHLGAGGQFVGTTLILAEFHSHLLYLRGPTEARVAVASLLEDPVHRQQGAERVAVRVLMRGQQQLVRAAQLGQHLFMSGGDAHWSSSSSVILIPRSIDSSKTNCSVGVRFIRSSRPIAFWNRP